MISLGRTLPLTIVGLTAVLVGMAGASAAQSGQSVTIQPGVIDWTEVPDQLPGTYQGQLSIRTTVSSGVCLCAPGTTTTVELQAKADEPVTAAVVSPSGYAIDWWAQPQDQQHGDHRVVQVTVHVAEAHGQLPSFDLITAGHTNAPLQTTEALDSSYAIPLPQDPQGATTEGAAADDDPGTNGSQEAAASTQSTSGPGELQQAAVPGAGVLAALLSLGLVAWRQRRGA